MSEQSFPNVDELAADLVRFCGRGFRDAIDADLFSLLCLASLVGTEQPQLTATLDRVELLIQKAMPYLGGGDVQTAAERLYGLRDGLKLERIGERRKRAAQTLGVSVSTVRNDREGKYHRLIAQGMLNLFQGAGEFSKLAMSTKIEDSPTSPTEENNETRVRWGNVRKIKNHPIVVAIVACCITFGTLVTLLSFFDVNYSTIKNIIATPQGGPTSVDEINISGPELLLPTASNTPSVLHPVVDDGNCPERNLSDKKIPEYFVCVMNWCSGPVLNLDGSVDATQTQIKLHPRIINNSGTDLDLGIGKNSALRLLVASSDLPASWQPPQLTAAEGDGPIILEYSGQSYWAIPPNVPHDEYLTEAGWTGYATSWDSPQLHANEMYPPLTSYRPDGNPIQQGNLVFQVPTQDRFNNSSLLGLALLERDTGRILWVSEFEDWGPRLLGNDF